MATHSSILVWRIPWTEESGRLQSMGSQRIRPNRATHTHTHTQRRHKWGLIRIQESVFCEWRGECQDRKG